MLHPCTRTNNLRILPHLPVLMILLLATHFFVSASGEFEPLSWERPADQNVFTTRFGNNHDAVIFVEPNQTYPYHMIISHTANFAQLWRSKQFSWNSSEHWELVEARYRITNKHHYEIDDGVKVGDTYYIYEDGLVYTYSGDLAQSKGQWNRSGRFPKDECDDIGVFYDEEEEMFHIFGEHGNFPHGPDGTSLSHFTSLTGLGDWQLEDTKAVDPNPDGGNTYGVGDATIIKIDGTYYLYCDEEAYQDPYKIVAWKSPSLYEPFERIGEAIKPRTGEVDDWDNYRIQDADIVFVPEIGQHVIFANMMDTDGNPGRGNGRTTRVIGVFLNDSYNVTAERDVFSNDSYNVTVERDSYNVTAERDVFSNDSYNVTVERDSYNVTAERDVFSNDNNNVTVERDVSPPTPSLLDVFSKTGEFP